jgi:hypothetical protein
LALLDRLKNSWNAFIGRDPTLNKLSDVYDPYGAYGVRPDRVRFTRGNERSIVTGILNRISVDAAQIDFKHVMLDKDRRFLSEKKSGLNNCLTMEANIDQTGRALIQDIVMSMLDEGCVAVVPTDTGSNPLKSESYDILTLRCGKIVEWRPTQVKVHLYNERTGKKEDIMLPKSMVAIIENPFYAILNEPNAIYTRLKKKLALLDTTDEEQASGKLNMILQLPYIIKTEARRRQAEQRRADLEDQLSSSKYGIAYTDGTEKVTQLGHPIDNTLLEQVKMFQDQLYSVMGITQSILDSTADEKTMQNYYSRTIEPILNAICDEMNRKFLTSTARTQGQAVWYFRNLFKLIPVTELPDLADKMTRNEIMTSNEWRQIIGLKPADDPSANELRNKNISQSSEEIAAKNGGSFLGEETTEQGLEGADEIQLGRKFSNPEVERFINGLG